MAENEKYACNNYYIESLIGSGSFGCVYLGRSKVDATKFYAIKSAKRDPKSRQLDNERRIYSQLESKVRGVPEILDYFTEHNFDFMVMTALGPSLGELKKRATDQKLPFANVCYAGIQLVFILQEIHGLGIAFRDLKPEQICIGEAFKDWPNLYAKFGDSKRQHKSLRKSSLNLYEDVPDALAPMEPLPLIKTSFPQVFLIDFGLASEIKSSPQAPKTSRIGTSKYASLNAHAGNAHGPLDDLESLVYAVVELMSGRLPWSSVKSFSAAEGWRKQYRIKRQTTASQLCAGLPFEIEHLYQYLRGLSAVHSGAGKQHQSIDYGQCANYFWQAFCRGFLCKNTLKRKRFNVEIPRNTSMWESVVADTQLIQQFKTWGQPSNRPSSGLKMNTALEWDQL